MGMIDDNYSAPAMQLEEMVQEEEQQAAKNACGEQKPASDDAQEIDE